MFTKKAANATFVSFEQHIKDEDIDFSDVPEISEEQIKTANGLADL
ncbi:MAG: hypothetical protein LBJ79_02025 [Endomicrobium sp.]|nr:hypothetical protein [Endomicrobium sp.]